MEEEPVPVDAEKDAEEAPEGMLTEAGIVNAEFEEESVTAAAEGTVLERVTVQEVLALAAREVAEHCSEETCSVATRGRLVEVDVPLRDAVRVAL